MVRIRDLALCLDAACPPAWAEEWDNVGLLAGDPDAEVRRCVCALDADGATVQRAGEAGAQLLVVHHPIPFRPLRRLLADDPEGAALWTAARAGVAVYAAHTNFDVHPEGVNRALAEALGLRDARPLRVLRREEFYKLVAFVPAGHEEAVLDALAAAGAGRLGRYSHCSFRAQGEGAFLPMPGARPFAGRVGVLHRLAESRLEVLVPGPVRDAVVAAMWAAHPYEEPAYDLIRLENVGAGQGLGLVGEMDRAVRLDRFARAVAGRLEAPATRFVGDPGRMVRRVAVCGGAGGELAADALGAGADVLVTADLRYHQARDAEARGLALVDPGHQATEAPAVALLADLVRRAAAAGGLHVDVDVAAAPADVWRATLLGGAPEPLERGDSEPGPCSRG